MSLSVQSRRTAKTAALALVCCAALGGCASVSTGDITDWFSPAVRRGESFAMANCAQCHAIGQDEDSNNPSSPPFKRIHRLHNTLSLERELQTIPTVGHYMMKPTPIEHSDIEDLVAYIDSLD